MEARESGADDVWWDRMRASARRVAHRLADELKHEAEEEAIHRRLDRLIHALRDEGSSLGSDAGTASELAMYQRLLELLYRETLGDWASQAVPLSSRDMLRFLSSFERVRESISPRWQEHFAFLWAVPQGADLVVELAHDLRSPLTSIIFLTESLRQGQAGELSEIQRRQLGIIYSAALSLISMASDVIELARGGLRLMERHPSPFSLAELLESTHDIFRPIVEEKKVAFVTRSPETDQRLGYPVALSRVLVNLTSNALRYTEQGSVEITARATGRSRVEFSVRDTGPGMDPETAQTLFEPLRQNPRSNRFALSGSGLGLVICRRLVEAMGGTLAFETAPGSGTCFFFELDLPSAPSA